MNRKLLLIILDGFGLNYSKELNPLFSVDTPNLDNLVANQPFAILQAAGEEVGLSWGEVGNSEVGHFNLGSGTILWQNLPKIDQSIESGEFFKKEPILKAYQNVKENDSSLHLIGLVSDGGVHSHIRHLFALLKLAKEKGLHKVYIHMISDGRDTPPDSAPRFIKELKAKISELGVGAISTIGGRKLAMDRDNNWDRINKYYEVLIGKSDKKFNDPESLIEHWYNNDKNDESLPPSIVKTGLQDQFISDDDSIVIFNFRADRARQLTLALGSPNLDEFDRSFYPSNIYLTTMTPYEEDWQIEVPTVFEPPKIDNPVSRIISENGLNQAHVAESEKKAHVTYFFNGGKDITFTSQENKIYSSPDVESYDLKPEMSLEKVVNELIDRVSEGKDHFILSNFANTDMVGHTGKFKPAGKAIQYVDQALGALIPQANKAGYVCFVTADHGNIEQMINPASNKPDKEHTTNPVPFFWVADFKKKESNKNKVGSDKLWRKFSSLNPTGILADVPATVLKYFQIDPPESLIGEDLSSNLNQF